MGKRNSAPSIRPAVGAPPTLEWVPVDRLLIDASYQRSVEDGRSQRLIQAIARNWDWRLYQPLSVSRRADGGLYVIDGQHRCTAARLRGDLPHLPCVIASYADAADEALAFAAMNRARKPMSAAEQWRAALAGGDPKAVDAESAIREAGLTLAPHSNPTAWQPGMIACIGGVARGIKKHGRQPTVNALIAIAEAFDGQVLQYAGSLLGGVILIYADPPEGFDPDRLIATLASASQQDWRDEAGELAAFSKIDQRNAMRDVLLTAYADHPVEALDRAA